MPAGERWPDDTLRVAAEDALGAGAIVAALGGRSLSPEAELVAAQFAAAAARLPEVLAGLASGRELIADGYGADVDLAAAHDVSPAAPGSSTASWSAERATGQLARRNGQLTAAGCRTHRVESDDSPSRESRLAVTRIATRVPERRLGAGGGHTAVTSGA